MFASPGNAYLEVTNLLVTPSLFSVRGQTIIVTLKGTSESTNLSSPRFDIKFQKFKAFFKSKVTFLGLRFIRGSLRQTGQGEDMDSAK